MIYSDWIHDARFYFPVLTALFFIIKLLGGESRDRIHSFIICVLCILYFLTTDIDENLAKEVFRAKFIEGLWIEILISGAGMMAMFFFAPHDKSAFKHALILAFIIFINFMLTWHYTVVSSPFFHSYFDELIILTGFVQIMVSRNGIRNSISRIIGSFSLLQGARIRTLFSCICLLGSIQIRRKGGKGT